MRHVRMSVATIQCRPIFVSFFSNLPTHTTVHAAYIHLAWYTARFCLIHPYFQRTRSNDVAMADRSFVNESSTSVQVGNVNARMMTAKKKNMRMVSDEAMR